YLARALFIFDPLTLRDVGRPVVNPHVVTISYGPNKGAFTFGVDQIAPFIKVENLKPPANPLEPYVISQNPLPPAGPLVVDPITRYSGIESTLKAMIQPNLGVQAELPERLKQLGHP